MWRHQVRRSWPRNGNGTKIDFTVGVDYATFLVSEVQIAPLTPLARPPPPAFVWGDRLSYLDIRPPLRRFRTWTFGLIHRLVSPSSFSLFSTVCSIQIWELAPGSCTNLPTCCFRWILHRLLDGRKARKP